MIKVIQATVLVDVTDKDVKIYVNALLEAISGAIEPITGILVTVEDDEEQEANDATPQ